MVLRDICKKRVLEEMVRATYKHQGYVAMVVDDKTLRILSSCCKVYDILENGVSVVELISKKRQPLPGLDALYFISAEEESVKLLLEDFSSSKQKLYNHAHLFFSSPIDPDGSLMHMIAKSSATVANVRSFYDFNLNFIAYEQRVFHLDSPSLLPRLYPSIEPALIHSISDKILTLCCTLKERPSIRYQSSPSQTAEKLASSLHILLKQHPVLANKAGDTTILILERSVDLATLFLHEYTYQAFAYDELRIPCCLDRSKANGQTDFFEDTHTYEITTASGKSETKQAILGEQDEMWVRYRHEHIQTVNMKVSEEAAKFTKENPAALFQKRENVNSGDAVKAVRALPEYQELLSKYWTHVSLGEECLKQLQQNNIIKVGYAEQDISCCVDKEGKEMNSTKLLNSLSSVLSDNSIKPELKLRLLLLYFTQLTGITETDRRKIFEAAELSLENQRCILSLLNLKLLPQELNLDDGASSGKHVHQLQSNRERVKFFKNRAKVAQYDLSRYEPLVKSLMVKCLDGTLSRGFYPYVDDPETPSPQKISPASKWSSAFGDGGTQWEWSSTSEITTSSTSTSSNNKKLIVFIIGDITFAEMRSAYEVSKALKTDVLIGGTAITTPKQLIDLLKEQKK